jgi:hypothetical protein
MPLPPQFATIWRKYEQMLVGLDADDPDDRREIRRINSDRQRELIAIGAFDAQGRPLFPQVEMDRALGARGPIAPYGLTRPEPTADEARQIASRGGPPSREIWQGPDPNFPGRAAPNFPGLTDPSGKSLYDPKTAPPRETAPAAGQGTSGGTPTGTFGGPKSTVAPGGQQPPAPGASYAGMSQDGRTVRWYMPDGTIQFTNAEGGTSGTDAASPTAPPKAQPPSGVSAGEYEDFLAFGKQALSRLGFGGRDISGEEIRLFVAGKMDASGVYDYFKTLPDIVAQNPGAPYDMTKDEYLSQRSEIERAAQAEFDLPASARPSYVDEPEYLREAFKEKMTPAEVEAGFKDIQRRRGRAPSGEDVRGFRTRPTVQTEEDRAGVAGKRTPLGPTSDLGGPDPNFVGGRRR